MSTLSEHKRKRVLASLRRIKKMVEATHWIKYTIHQTKVVDGLEKHQYCLLGFTAVESGKITEDGKTGNTSDAAGLYRMHLNNAISAGIEKYDRKKLRTRRRRAIPIYEFNDRRNTKRDDVLAVLDLAIEHVKEKS